MRDDRTRWLAWVLALLGLAACVLLTLRAFAVASGDTGEAFDVCSAVFASGCDATLADRSSLVLGIPWAGWGLVYYAALLVLLGLAAVPGRPFSPEVDLGAFLLDLAGALCGLALCAVMLLGSVPVCPLCLVVHGVNLLLVPLLWRRCGMLPAEALRRIGSALRLAVGGRPRQAAGTAAKVVAFLCALLTAVIVYQRVSLEWGRLPSAARETSFLRETLEAWRGAPQVELPLREDDPRLGPVDAPAQVVVFSSLQCRGCAQLAGFLAGLRKRVGDRLSVVFKHYPLGSACNEHVDGDYHPYACAAAAAAEAARLQGRFWAFHDLVHVGGLPEGADTLDEVARAIGLDLERFARDGESEEVAARVRADIELGHGLGIDGTPSIFLNRRRVNDLRSKSVERLILHACGLQAD